MTKTTAKTAATETYFDQVKQAFDTVQSKIEVPAAARDFVKRGTETAKERAETVHANAIKFADSAEKLTNSFVGGYANFVRGMFDATLANVQHSLATVEKVAGAKSFNEAVQIQADFVRENASANLERARTAAETARTVVVDGAKAVQTEVAALYKKAA